MVDLDSQKIVRNLLAFKPLIPVVTIPNIKHAAPITEALLKAKIGIIEVTLRNEAALTVLHYIVSHYPEIIVAAGTVLNANQMAKVVDAGAQLIVSPGHTDDLIHAATKNGIAYLPGANTVSEVMKLREHGYLHQKFYPAGSENGLNQIKACGAVMPDVRFCPTGGITQDNAQDYLDLDNVACVGGSWVVPPNLVAIENWAEILEIAQQTMACINHKVEAKAETAAA